ncbi:MAG: DUF4240 domain-containing protein [Candidatus Obscuribacterales bacterium]
MKEDRFWTIVESARGTGTYSVEEHLSALKHVLSDLTDRELAEFQLLLYQLQAKAYSWDLWGAAVVINGGCGDDGFTDFRTGLIFQGRDLFEKALDDPDSLCELENAPNLIEYELLGYAADYVFEERTGQIDLWSHFDEVTSVYKPVQDPTGEPWGDDDELEGRFPQLSARFGVLY